MVDIASDEVEIQFLIDYLSMVSEFKDPKLRVPKEILDPVIALAESKAGAAVKKDYLRKLLPPTNFQLKVAASFPKPNLVEMAKRSFEKDIMPLSYEILMDRLKICQHENGNQDDLIDLIEEKGMRNILFKAQVILSLTEFDQSEKRDQVIKTIFEDCDFSHMNGQMII